MTCLLVAMAYQCGRTECGTDAIGDVVKVFVTIFVDEIKATGTTLESVVVEFVCARYINTSKPRSIIDWYVG